MNIGFCFRVSILKCSYPTVYFGHAAGAAAYGEFNLVVSLLGSLGAILIQLAAHYSGESSDLKEDRLAASLGKTPLAAGSQFLV